MELEELLKKDKSNLSYIDYDDIKVKELDLLDFGRPYSKKRSFLEIEGIDNYIIKDSTDEPLFFNTIRNKELLRKLINKQGELPEIDFPIAYYKNSNKMKGIVIPYYKNAVSLKRVIYLEGFYKLSLYYDQSNDKIENLISLFLDILELIIKMYEKQVYYIDIHSGNFVLYENMVKIIDFDPGFVLFNDRNNKNYARIIRNYADLVHIVCKRFNFKDILFNKTEDFTSMEQNVKSLYKRLER